MSRCFPFPPPGYSGNCSSNEALILSIKLQREREKSNSDREREKTIKSSEKKEKKDRKKEKKEKKEKREERKASSDINNGKQKLSEKLYQVDKCDVEPNGKCSLQKDELELLEKSSVTEEHGQASLQNVSCSSDSTGNSCKRERLTTPPSGIQSNGNVIRIRFSSSHKRDEPSTSGSKEQEISAPLHRRSDHSASYSKVQPCSNIVRTEALKRQRDAPVKAPTDISCLPSMSDTINHSVSRQDKAIPGFPCEKTESVLPKEKPKKEKLLSHEKKLRKKESKYNKLFEGWVPFSVETGLLVEEDDADDWLFGKKGEERQAKKLKSSDHESSGDNLPSCASSALQPRSHFLPDADIYALPFTVPF